MNASKNDRRAANWFGCGVLALTVAACSSQQPPVREPSQATSAAPRATADGAPDEVASNIRLSDELRRECQLPNAPREAPRFETGQAAVPPVGRSILDDVANCLTDGPLSGRAVLVVGRSDPRGSTDQNQQLSENRAEAAKNYLAQRGVARDNIRTAARGEHGAQGKDETGWALDRRVDIELVSATASAVGAATPSPILEGTRMQAVSSSNNLATQGAGSGPDTSSHTKSPSEK